MKAMMDDNKHKSQTITEDEITDENDDDDEDCTW